MSFSDTQKELDSLIGGLVVSCQARPDNPLHGPRYMATMAEAAVQGGAVGIRANGPEDVAAIRARVNVPIIGINKVTTGDGLTFITPSRRTAQEVMTAGARLVALDGTNRPRPGGEDLADVIDSIHKAGGVALADVSTLNEGLYAASCGADLVGSTLSGYTPYSPSQAEPDLELVRELARSCPVPVFAEGRYWEPSQVSAALKCGAAFVVIGTAITNPREITRRFASALDRGIQRI